MSNCHSGVMIISCLDYPFYSGASRRIEGFLSVLESNKIKACVICPLFQRSSSPPAEQSRNVYYIDLRILRKLRHDLSTTRLIALALFTLGALPKIIRMSKSYKIIQYVGTGSAPSVLFLKPLLRNHMIVGDDFMPMYQRMVKPFAWIIALFDFMTVQLTDVIITYPAFWNTFLRKYVRSEQVLHIPHGVFYIKPKIKLEKKTVRRMVFVGSLTFDQNLIAIANIIKIAKSLMKRGINFSVEIVGGPLESAGKFLDEEVVQRGLVRFRGFVSEEVLQKIYLNSFIGLLPFFDDTKSFSQKIKPLEYFAHGLLVVSGTQGIVGIGGLANGREYLEAKDAEEMTEIIAKCLESPNDYFDIVLRGIEVAKRYSWESLLKPYINLIKKRSACGVEKK